MDEYERSTRECLNLNHMRAELAGAIRTYFAENDLKKLEGEAIFFCETTSTKRKVSLADRLLFGNPDKVHHEGILLTPRWLFWARSGEKYGTSVSFARLSEIELQNTSEELRKMNAKIIPEGIWVFGLINHLPKRATAFIGLGKEPAAEKFRALLKEAIQKERG